MRNLKKQFKKVKNIYFNPEMDDKGNPYFNGLIIELENGKVYEMNTCQDCALEPFSEIKK